jgi:phosphoglycolate phosphatase-like HAD superfamily hydrolase
MRVFGFAELMPVQRLHAAGAHHVFDRMLELPDLIASHARTVT